MNPINPFDPGNMQDGEQSAFPASSKFATRRIQWIPAVDIYETETEVVAIAEIPGVRSEDMKISFKDSVLTIEGVKNKVSGLKGLSFFCVERSYGSFARSFRIVSPVDRDAIDARSDSGILTVILPKRK